MTTSCGSRCSASKRARTEPGRIPSSRCRVEAVVERRKRRSSSVNPSVNPSVPAAETTASVRRAAALPVGAASATRGGPSDRACTAASNRATVVVLPVPGPPPSTDTPWARHTAAAARWSSARPPGHSRSSTAATAAGS